MSLYLQKALKEKEEHIEQLLRERDLERSEVARSAAQVDEVGLYIPLMPSRLFCSSTADKSICRINIKIKTM